MSCGRTAPEVSEEEGSYALCFYRSFLEGFKSCYLLLLVSPGLIDTLAQLLALKGPTIIAYEVATKVLDTE